MNGKFSGKHVYIPISMTEFGNTEQAKVSDNHFPTLQEYIFWLQVLVYNTFGMKIPHTLQWIQEHQYICAY